MAASPDEEVASDLPLDIVDVPVGITATAETDDVVTDPATGSAP